MAKMMRGAKCNCNLGWGIVAAILFAIGAFIGIQGFVIQFQQLQGGWDGNLIMWTLAYYFVGFLFLGAGKIVKWKTHGMCPVHGMSK